MRSRWPAVSSSADRARRLRRRPGLLTRRPLDLLQLRPLLELGHLAHPRRSAGPGDAGPSGSPMTSGRTWFPSPSPDGRSMVFISFPKGTKGHPADKDVVLRRMPMPTDAGSPGPITEVVRLFGGQGTMNVNSWSPIAAGLPRQLRGGQPGKARGRPGRSQAGALRACTDPFPFSPDQERGSRPGGVRPRRSPPPMAVTRAARGAGRSESLETTLGAGHGADRPPVRILAPNS